MGDHRAKGWVLDWERDPGGMSRASGAVFRWRCHACEQWSDLDVAEYLRRTGPCYPMHNELSECPCGGPRSLYTSSGGGSPLRPHIDPSLFICRELGFGRDPEAWFEIRWMDGEGRRRR